MDINPNIHQDDTQKASSSEHDRPRVLNTESALWFRLDWLIRASEQNRESSDALRMHLVNEVRIMNEWSKTNSFFGEKGKVYCDAVVVLEDWARIIPK
jgi:hypothetical protein